MKSHAMFIYSSFTIKKNLSTKNCNEPRHLVFSTFITTLILHENVKRSDLTPIKGLRKAYLSLK